MIWATAMNGKSWIRLYTKDKTTKKNVDIFAYHLKSSNLPLAVRLPLFENLCSKEATSPGLESGIGIEIIEPPNSNSDECEK